MILGPFFLINDLPSQIVSIDENPFRRVPLIDEAKIIEECLSGNVESFGLLVKSYQDALLRTAYRFLRDWDDAKDAVQEAFIRAYRYLSTYRSDRRFSTWLYKILVNVCLDRLKSADRRHHKNIGNTIEDKNSFDPLDRLAERELLHRALQKLSTKRRQAFILVHLEEFSCIEAAEIMGCSESTVRVTVMKARQQLRKAYLELNQV
jgi:RNA polymerase sigma-70 factor (ECF subfamily)